jgi:hypothetical protein
VRDGRVENGTHAAPDAAASPEYDHVGRRLKTLEQCALHKRTLRLTCPKCSNVRVLDAVSLWWLFNRSGWEDTLVAVRLRLCCAACREREGSVVRPHLIVGREAPTGDPIPYPDASAWKKLVSRYRS